MEDVGKLLRKYRMSKGVTLTHVARKAGISIARLHSIETGRRKLELSLYFELCEKGYEVDPFAIARQLLKVGGDSK